MLARNRAGGHVQMRQCVHNMDYELGLQGAQVNMDTPRAKRAPTGAAKTAGTQSIQRASLVLRLIASRGRTGLRLADVVQHSGLEHPTVHRILRGLAAEGMVAQDAASRRYFLGPLVFELGLAAAPQFNLSDICSASMHRIADKTGDTVFLTVRSGFDSVCIDRKEGSFPIKTLTLDVGARRPLGAGAGGLALLLPLPDEIVEEIIATNARRYASYNNLSVPALLKALKRSRQLGYALNDRHSTTGAITLGLPILNPYGQPLAAISIGAISMRMTEDRQKELVSILRAEVRLVEKAMAGTARS
jgi:DNA-binding IclR family transcriptional regulator